MKTRLLLTLLILTGYTYSQAVVTDPILTTAVVTSSIVAHNDQEQIKKNQTKMQALQATIALKVEQLKEKNEKFQERLTDVKSVIRDSKRIIQIGIISKDIIDMQIEILKEVADDPKLSVLALKAEKKTKEKFLDLNIRLGTVLKGGEKFQFTSAERINSLNRIHSEFSLIRGLTFGILLNFRWAKNGNFIKKTMQEYDLGLLYGQIKRSELATKALPKL